MAGGTSAEAAPDDRVSTHARGRRTQIDKGRLQTFNFQVVDHNRAGTAEDVTTMSTEELSKYVDSVLRFVPVEVAMRYYDQQLVGPSGERAYTNSGHEVVQLGDQGYEHHFQSCVLFSDISGFTKLTNRLLKEHGNEGAEILNGIINKFFEELIAIITRHSGDVIKFAGDAVLSIWSSNTHGESIEMLTHRAVACALEQIQTLHNWDTKEGVMLQLHLGLGAGKVQGIDLGNPLRREFVVAGEPLKQLSDAEQQAESGQLVVSPEAWDYVRGHCSGTQVATDPKFGPGFYVVTKCHDKPPLPPHWRVILQDQMKATSPPPKSALDNFYVYAPGPMRPHLVSGKLSAASDRKSVV